jgi:hypothetical protein
MPFKITMTTAVQLWEMQATPNSVPSYDLFSRDGHACCAKLDDESVEVFESMTEVTVSWSNGISCSGNLLIAARHDSSDASLDTENTVSCSAFANVASLEQGLDAIRNARLKLMWAHLFANGTYSLYTVLTA